MNESKHMTVRPLTPGRWPDLEALFNARGCGVARNCWCMYYRRSGPTPVPPGMTRRETERAALKRLVESGKPPGLIGYRDKVPVGWISLGPRKDYARLARSPVMRPVDDEPVWSIICYVVPAAFRRQGVARSLLDAAIEYARKQGARILEAYPVDKPRPSQDGSLWFGTKAIYDAAGFREVARRKPHRPVVRKYF